MVSDFNPQNWLTGSMAPWLHVEEGQGRAEQRSAAQRMADDADDECEYRNQSTNPSTLPRKSYLTTQAGESRIGQGSAWQMMQMMQMMNMRTLIDKAIQSTGLPSRAKATTQAGEREREREQMMNVSTESINASIHPSNGLSPV